VGTLVLAAGLAWPSAPLGDPLAGAARPDLFGTLGTPPRHSPGTVAPPSAAPSDPPSPADTSPAPQSTTAGPAAPAAAQGPGLPPAPAPRANGQWTLVDQDDFAGSRVDGSKWQVYDADATNGISRWSSSMVSVSGGELRIAGRGRNPSGEGNVSGGLCWCNGAGNQLYGRWEVRARFEAGVGYGQAILLWPQSNRWPEDGELDFVETPNGSKNLAVGTVHWGSSNTEDYRNVSGDFTQWHTYVVEWESGYVKMYIDDKLFYDSTTSSRRPQIPNTKMQLAIQQEPGPFGSNWVPAPNSSTPDTVTMHIDWVRIYR
jgi:beta-glucanase (GH16 family)